MIHLSSHIKISMHLRECRAQPNSIINQGKGSCYQQREQKYASI